MSSPKHTFTHVDTDLQEWVINEPRILGEELLVIASEYQNFEQTHDLIAMTFSHWIHLASLSSSN